MSKESVVRNNMWKWLVLLLVSIGSVYLAYPPREKVRLGLDLAGGSSFTLGVDYARLQDKILEREPEKYKNNPAIKLSEFCQATDISDTAMRKWIKQYDECGIEGLARADAEIKDILPEGVDRTEEAYKKEILKLRIENERLKKTILYGRTRLGNRSMFA